MEASFITNPLDVKLNLKSNDYPSSDVNLH